jgi:UDP-N-acetylmuramate dehydrogenase
MTIADWFPEIVKRGEPLAPYTHLRIGGPAEFLVQPRSVPELAAVLRRCKEQRVPVRMLGGGYNLLVRDEPVVGAVVRLQGEAFAGLERDGRTVRAAGGAQLFDLLAFAVRAGLGGLETLVGIRGTVGGSVRCNVGDKTGEIGSSVRRVAVLADDGAQELRSRDDLNFSDHGSDLVEPVILWVEFDLEPNEPEVLLRRMRKAWVQRQAGEPLSFQAGVRMFRNPTGGTASSLIERAGLAKHRCGGAEVSERNGNYAIVHPGTTAADVLGLIESVRKTVRERTGLLLEQELNVW